MPDDIYGQAVQDYITGAKAQAASGLDTTPDDAARTVQLESATGVPSQVIAPDLDQFEQTHQRAMASRIVAQNPQLMAYVHSHPMAAGVSSDDWGAMDAFSQKAGATAKSLQALNAPWQNALSAGATGAVQGFKEGFGELPTFEPGPTAAGNLLQSAGLLGQIATQGMSGIFDAITHGLGSAAEAGASGLGMDPGQAAKFGRDIQAMTEYHMISPGGDWVAAHEEPPKGINPHVDQAKAQINAEALEHLDDDLTAAQASATKERSPDMFARFVEQHYGNTTIGIHSDAALDLYGDKTPTPDDGILGWVPGIADKLDLARHTGADVEIPVSDWIAKVDPKLAQELHDDIRVWPGGITAREAGEAKPPPQPIDEVTGQPLAPKVPEEDVVQGIPFEYKQMVDSPLAQVRGASGLEPMFSQGDRKLSLALTGKEATDESAGIFGGDELHSYDILDENGQRVGDLHLVPGPGGDLHVEGIGGTAGQWANSFGPSLIRDLLRQVKELYPDAKTMSGMRISGGRKEAGAIGQASVRLDVPDLVDNLNTYEKAKSVLSDSYRVMAPGIEANVQPSKEYLANEKAIAGAIHDELKRISGGKAKVIPTAGFRTSVPGMFPEGLYFRRASLIMYDLLGDDPVGVTRHESIHFLRDQGLLTDREWNSLKEAAKDEDWYGRYHINERYDELYKGKADIEDTKAEEAVAEAFREWMRTKDGAKRQYSPIAQTFQKIKEFLGRISQRLAEIFGHEPTFNELFHKIESGQVGDRAAQGSMHGGVMFSIEELDNLKADGLGLDRKSFANIQRLVQERYRADVEASVRSAEKEQARRQTKEWKDNKTEMAKEVEATIRQRPDVAADLFIGSGEYGGEKLQQRFTLRSDDLSAEQRAGLPAHYTSKNGLPVDEVARLFGYGSGDAMVSRLTAYNALKAGKSPKEMLDQVVDQETERQMEARHGNLAENILSEAKDQALSQNDLNLLIEEYHAAAMQAGVTGADKDMVQGKAKDLVANLPLGEIDFNKQMTQIGRHYRDAVRSLVAGDPASAVVSLEKRTLAGFVAAEMKRVTAEKGKFDNVTKRYAKPWDPTKTSAVQPDYSLFVRDMLSKVGIRNGMSVPGLAKAVSESGFDGLQDFVTKAENDNKISGLELPVPDWLLRPGPVPKSYTTMKVAEFRELRDAVTTMDKVGRADQKVLQQGAARDRAEWIGSAVGQLKEKFPPIPSQKRGGLNQAFTTFMATLTSNETLLSRFDGRDNHGIFTETITKPGAEAANRKARLQREIAAKYRELGPIKDGERTLDSPFRDPRTGEPLEFTRRNLATVISNMGNNYNWSILAKGWKLDPEALMKWVESVSTPEDIERAQGLGNIFKGLKAEADQEYQHLYGIAPENVVPRPFTMHGKQYDGWYHPIIGDPQLSRFVNKMPDLGAEYNFWPATSNSYMKRRTGAQQVVDLTYDSVPGRLDQVIHDISFRAFVSNTAKIFKDDRFRSGIRTYYGKEYMEEMDKWLQSLAGDASYNTGAMQLASRWMNILRQNVITTQIAFNVGTVEKHGLTAGLMSARELSPNLLRSLPELGKVTAEVGASSFQRAVRDMFGKSPALGDSLFQFIKGNSEEIQRRERNYLDTIGGSHQMLEGRPSIRQGLSQWGAKMVAWSDMLSAAPLWLAKYRQEFDANGGVHGDAVREADMAVRRAHGSMAVTNLPSIARGSGPITPWFTSLYGFMGTSMQRRIEIFHDLNDAGGLARQGQIGEAAKMIPQILSSTAVYVVYTGLVEELVSGQFTQDRRGLGSKALTFLFGTVAQSIIGLRDLVYDLQTGRESAGLISTPINDLTHLKRDLAKHSPLAKAHAGQLIQDGCTSIGDLFGVCPKHLGTLGHYGLDVFSGFAHPHGAGDVYRGAVSGTQKVRIQR